MASPSPVKSSTIEEEGGVITSTATNNKDNVLQVGEKIYLMLDPLDPRKIALDIFEVYCHEMLCTKFIGRRAYLITKMRVSLVYIVILWRWVCQVIAISIFFFAYHIIIRCVMSHV